MGNRSSIKYTTLLGCENRTVRKRVREGIFIYKMSLVGIHLN